MKLNQRPGLAWYFRLFHFVAKNRLAQNDVDQRQIHTVLATVLSTGILMWAYAFLAMITISSPIPGIIGFLCAIVHLLSPLLFRLTNNPYIVANTLLGAGMVHQGTFSFYSGGFMSPILIWFGILPLIGGITCGRKGALTWVGMTMILPLIFLGLQNRGFQFPYSISETGAVIAQTFIVFGWIFLSSIMIIVYTGLREETEERLIGQSQKIDDLFRVLFHDLANPLGRITIGLTIAKKQVPANDNNRGFEIAALASESMLEITQNIRRMYAASKGKANLDLLYCPIHKSIDYLKKTYAADLEKKQLSLIYHGEKNHLFKVLVEPVSFNNQVMGNIISNAIKFSPIGGKIKIDVQAISDEKIVIAVSDQGIGMSNQLVNQLFDLSKKTNRTGTEGETGTGFGMHIMKSFVDMYSGEVSISSTEATAENKSSGTTIRLILKGKSS